MERQVENVKESKPAQPGGWNYQKHIGLQLTVFTAVMLLGVVLSLLFTRNLMPNANSIASVLSRHSDSAYEDVRKHLGGVAAEAVALSKALTADMEAGMSRYEISADEWRKNPDFLQDYLDREMDLLLLALERANCSGVFIVLDATVNPYAPRAESSRAGVFIRRVEPKRIGNPSEMLYLRGFTGFALKRNLTLQANWDLEIDIAKRSFWNMPLYAVQEAADEPLMNYFYWSFESVIPENKSASLLCSIPLLDAEGNAFGVCGLELTETNFRYLHPASGAPYADAALLFSTLDGNAIGITGGFFSGIGGIEKNLAGVDEVRITSISDNPQKFLAGGEVYRGYTKEMPLYANNAWFADDSFALTFMISEALYQNEIQNDILRIVVILTAMLVLGFILIGVLSKRLAHPVNAALESIKNDEPIPTVGIEEFDELMRMFAERNPGQTAQVSEMFEDFLSKLGTLTPTEQAIVTHYADGKSFEEARAEMFVAASTMRTHNLHIYKKLSINGIDELRLYLDLIRRSDAAENLKMLLKTQ